MLRRKRPVRPPCPCGVKKANYSSPLGMRCARHASVLWKAVLDRLPDATHEQLDGTEAITPDILTHLRAIDVCPAPCPNPACRGGFVGGEDPHPCGQC